MLFIVLVVILFVICIYLWVQVSKLNDKVKEQGRIIDELCRRTGNEGMIDVPESYSLDWYEGCYISEPLRERLRALKSEGKYDEAVRVFARETCLPERYAGDYLRLL